MNDGCILFFIPEKEKIQVSVQIWWWFHLSHLKVRFLQRAIFARPSILLFLFILFVLFVLLPAFTLPPSFPLLPSFTIVSHA